MVGTPGSLVAKVAALKGACTQLDNAILHRSKMALGLNIMAVALMLLTSSLGSSSPYHLCQEHYCQDVCQKDISLFLFHFLFPMPFSLSFPFFIFLVFFSSFLFVFPLPHFIHSSSYSLFSSSLVPLSHLRRWWLYGNGECSPFFQQIHNSNKVFNIQTKF